MNILISQSGLHLGGAESALIAMLENLDYNKVNVDLFLYQHEGELLHAIPPQVNLLPEIPDYAALGKPLTSILFTRPRAALCRLLAKLTSWLYSDGKDDNYTIYEEIDYWGSFLLPNIPNFHHYDACISYLANHRIERKRVKASTYIAWIHTDYSSTKFNRKRSLKGWRLFDHIISISPSVSEAFCRVFPSLSSRLQLIENGLRVKEIRRKAMLHSVDNEMNAPIKILSVGRFSTAKNFPGAVGIMAELCKLRDDVSWYIIGYGGEEEEIRSAIRQYGLEEKFIILGKKSNPYPYMQACDLYIQPSIYEGKCVAVLEAQALAKPVAITCYPTAASQLEDGVDGIIIPFGSKEAALCIHKLLDNPEYMKKMSKSCQSRDYSGKETLSTLYRII